MNKLTSPQKSKSLVRAFSQSLFSAARPPQYGSAKYEKCPPSFSIWSWNINGLNANAEKGTLEKFISEADPEILVLNETKTDLEKIDKKKFHKLIPEGYEQHWNCSIARKGYSGVAILSKIKPISVNYGINVDKHDQEGRVLTAEYEDFYLVGVYVPNAGEGLKRLAYRAGQWDVDFRNYLETLKKDKPVILTGDLNVAHHPIDVYDTKGKHTTAGYTPEERANFGELLGFGWVDTFREYYPEERKFSFWSMRAKLRPRNMGWRLDYFVVSKDFMTKCQDSTIHNEYFGSDHCPIQLKVSFDGSTTAKEKKVEKEKEPFFAEMEKSKKREIKAQEKSSQKSTKSQKSQSEKTAPKQKFVQTTLDFGNVWKKTKNEL